MSHVKWANCKLLQHFVDINKAYNQWSNLIVHHGHRLWHLVIDYLMIKTWHRIFIPALFWVPVCLYQRGELPINCHFIRNENVFHLKNSAIGSDAHPHNVIANKQTNKQTNMITNHGLDRNICYCCPGKAFNAIKVCIH